MSVLRVPSTHERLPTLEHVPDEEGPGDSRLRGVPQRHVLREGVVLHKQRHQPGLLHDVLDQVPRGVLAADDATRGAAQRLVSAQLARSAHQSAHFRFVAARRLPVVRRTAALQRELSVQDLVAEERLRGSLR